MDVWLLDLRTITWLHPPAMPAYAALKGTDLAWAADGRLVLLGQFAQPEQGYRPMLATWRPGEPELRLMPYERPSANDTGSSSGECPPGADSDQRGARR